MAEATGKFLLVEGDDDNYAKIMAAIGLTAEQIELGRGARPTVEYIRDGDNYTCIISAPGMPERRQTFQLDVEIDEVALGGRRVKSTYKRNGKLMIQHEKQADGKVVVYEREVKGDEMHVKVSIGDLVAHRLFKRL